DRGTGRLAVDERSNHGLLTLRDKPPRYSGMTDRIGTAKATRAGLGRDEHPGPAGIRRHRVATSGQEKFDLVRSVTPTKLIFVLSLNVSVVPAAVTLV
ncbi:MAG TPA: hypothetical protein VNZ06_04325, partial [Steroidobacteraceae bacterium]|nr:hypothetical protein [Steroidobacteraceae bacterium]